MEFVKSQIKVKIYGQEFTLSKPKFGEIKEMNQKMSLEGADQVAVMMEMMTKLGLPMEVASEMEVDHFSQLVEVLCDYKKK